MTDTVNVPRELVEETIRVLSYTEGFSAAEAERRLIDALAAAPKAEPVSDPYKLEPLLWSMHILGPDDMYPAPDLATAFAWCEYVNSELAPRTPDVLLAAIPALWDGAPEQHAKNLPDAIKGWTVPAQPEAPKVEQEPVAWQLGHHVPLKSTVTEYRNVAEEAAKAGYTVTPLYTAPPAPASDELLEALRPFAINVRADWEDGEPFTSYFSVASIRRAAAVYAKHKGPQS